MKGVVFVEFLDMVEATIGMEATEELIEESELASEGIYTTVGTYPDSEMISLVVNLHQRTQIPIPTLLHKFGEFLFDRFLVRYASMLSGMTSGFDLLKKIDNYIHVEVQKLYPEANLPKFDFEEIDENTLKLIYKSQRKMPDLAEGLISASMKHFGSEATITREYVEEDGSWVNFIVKQH